MKTKEVYRGGPGISPAKEEVILKQFVLDVPASIAAEMAGVSRPCVHGYYQRYRQAIYRQFVKSPRLSGIVEVDIAEFGGKGRKKLNALLKKYARLLTHFEYQAKAKEIRARHKTRVLVFAERHKDAPARLFASVIKTKSAGDLFPLVRLVVKEDSIIISDKEPGLSRLKEEYKHKTFNSREIKDRRPGYHTANADAFMSFTKRRLAKFNGLHAHTTALHIKECLWRYSFRDKTRKDLKKALEVLLFKQT